MIRFDHVTKAYSGTAHPALNDVNIEIQSGEFVFLVGASGSGKSSFLRLVLKEERPSRGDVHVLGQHLNTLASRKVPFFRRKLGVVFQDFRLLPGKTVFDNVAFSLQVIGKSSGFIQEAVPDVLKMVGLGGKQGRYPHELSGGEQQRVAIARAVVNKPAILLADEPTGNLDPATSAGIMQLLSTINANGTTVLMATHDVGIVNQMRRRVIELVSGQVVRDEQAGGYQTQAIPVQRPASAVTTGAMPASAVPQAAMPVPTAAQAAPAGLATPLEAPVTAPMTSPPPTASLHLPSAFTPDPDDVDDRTVPRFRVTEAAAPVREQERTAPPPDPAPQTQQVPEVLPELNEPPAPEGRNGR